MGSSFCLCELGRSQDSHDGQEILHPFFCLCELGRSQDFCLCELGRSKDYLRLAETNKHFSHTKVVGSLDLFLICRFTLPSTLSFGEVPEWLKGADCKSAGSGLRWFESTPHQFLFLLGMVSYLTSTVVAQLVEQRIPNPQVGGSIPSDRAILNRS
jgi:hypothetical protein